MEVLPSSSSTIWKMQPLRSLRKGRRVGMAQTGNDVCRFCLHFMNKTRGLIFPQGGWEGKLFLCSGRKGELDVSEKQWLLLLDVRLFLVFVSLEAMYFMHTSNFETVSSFERLQVESNSNIPLTQVYYQEKQTNDTLNVK